MASPAPAAPAPAPAGGSSNLGITDKIRSTDATTLQRILKVANIINAGLLAATGVLVFVLYSPSVIEALSAIYVIVFALVLCVFELHWFEQMTFSNCGFMFTWKGRALFFIFIGTLGFGLGPMGIAAGVYTAVNVLFNTYVLYASPSLSQLEKQQENKRRQEVGTLAMKDIVTTAQTLNTLNNMAQNQTNPFATPSTNQPGTAYGASNAANTTAVASSAPAAPASSTPSGDWEKLYDPNTNQYYYHNSNTGETRWDAP